MWLLRAQRPGLIRRAGRASRAALYLPDAELVIRARVGSRCLDGHVVAAEWSTIAFARRYLQADLSRLPDLGAPFGAAVASMVLMAIPDWAAAMKRARPPWRQAGCSCSRSLTRASSSSPRPGAITASTAPASNSVSTRSPAARAGLPSTAVGLPQPAGQPGLPGLRGRRARGGSWHRRHR